MSTRLKIQLAGLLSKAVRTFNHLTGNKDDVIIAKRKGIYYQLDLREGIDFAIYINLYENTTIQSFQSLIKPGDTVLDIGANIGAHTLPLAKIVGDKGTVHAFEPTAFAYAKLTRNIKLNPLLATFIIANQVMLVDNDTQAPAEAIYSSWPLEKQNDVHPKHLGDLKSTAGCRALTLETYVKEHDIQAIDFIKLDVDGFEYKVLKGAIQVIEKFKPIILMELAPYVLEEQGNTLGELIELMKNLGYRFYHLNSDIELPIESFKTFPAGKSINIVLRMLNKA